MSRGHLKHRVIGRIWVSCPPYLHEMGFKDLPVFENKLSLLIDFVELAGELVIFFSWKICPPSVPPYLTRPNVFLPHREQRLRRCPQVRTSQAAIPSQNHHHQERQLSRRRGEDELHSWPSQYLSSHVDLSNQQPDWSKVKLYQHKYADRKTYVDEIQLDQKKRNSPSPSQYSLTSPWPKKSDKSLQRASKTNFLNHSEYESNMTPGPGSYLIATRIGKKAGTGKTQ